MNSLLPDILLVDDEERFVKSLHTILKYYNYSCTIALNGTEAIRLLQEKEFDLALLDVELPDMSGCDIAEYIKTSHPTTTAVMLTGVNTVETAVKAMKQGAYDFLSKPINHELLIKTIHKALQHNTLTRELHHSEKKYEALAEASWEGIVLHENGKLIEANNQFFEMFGYDPEKLREGMFLDKILTQTSLSIVNNHIKNSIFTSHEIVGKRKDGSEFPVETNSRSTLYLGRPARVCAMRDLSDRVRAEQEKLALQKNLAKANKLKALGLMAGSVAHDLNNILSGVVSYPDLLLLQMDENDRFYPEIKKIQEAGKRAAAVVADLVVLARGGTSGTSVENMNKIILDHLSSIEHSERLSVYPDVMVQTNLQQDLHNTRCSPQNIHKILLNLIGNGLESVGKNGLIRIATENCRFANPIALNHPTGLTENYIKITVADNGPGIPAKDLDHIFDPFYTTKIMGKSGTGLGLSIVWNTVQEHNGWIEVKDNNPGAVFEIYLPASREATEAEPAINYCSLQGNGETILLIDDQPEQNETMGRLLKNLGYTTFSATSGEEGIAFIKSKPVDLVLLDMIMGDGLNGSETYEQILQVQPSQKAIMISGYSRNEDVLKARNLGISHFLEKPVTLPTISHAIRQSLSRI
jgi:PAS domain S-box-containing protein